MAEENELPPYDDAQLENLIAEDLTPEDQKNSFFCDTNGENYYLMGICVGKVVTYWVGGIIAALGGVGGILTYFFG